MIETGWLIESTTIGYPQWLASGNTGLVFTTDSNIALRFARQQDGELTAKLILPAGAQYQVTEHQWG
jgi:hypothetical protein